MEKNPKKMYNTPLLVKHGDIKGLTKSAMGDGSDLEGGEQY